MDFSCLEDSQDNESDFCTRVSKNSSSVGPHEEGTLHLYLLFPPLEVVEKKPKHHMLPFITISISYLVIRKGVENKADNLDSEGDAMIKEINQRFIHHAREVDLMVYDAQYLQREYSRKTRMEHGTVEDAVKAA